MEYTIQIPKEILDADFDIEKYLKQSIEERMIEWLKEDNKRIEQELLYGTSNSDKKPIGFLNA